MPLIFSPILFTGCESREKYFTTQNVREEEAVSEDDRVREMVRERPCRVDGLAGSTPFTACRHGTGCGELGERAGKASVPIRDDCW